MTWDSWEVSSHRSEKNVIPDLVLKNIKYTKTKHGRAIWTLSATQARHDSKNDIIKAERIKLVFHQKKGGDIVLTADQGQIDSHNSILKVIGHVRIENRPDSIITTNWLEYDERTGLLKTTAPVHVVFDDSCVDANGLLIDTKTEKLLLLSDIDAILDQGENREGH